MDKQEQQIDPKMKWVIDTIKTMKESSDVITATEARKLVETLISLTTKQKEELVKSFDNFSTESYAKIQEAISTVSQKHADALLEVRQLTNKQKKAHEDMMAKCMDLLLEIKSIDVQDGIDGKDADEEKIVEDVLARIPKPEQVVLDDREKIVTKINSGGKEKIDASQIKNLPQSVQTIVQGSAGFIETPLKAGANITITKDASGANVITGSAGSTVGPGTLNEIAYFDSTSTVASLATATYPSLTELSYVKGVTSAIQTQINTKAPSTSPTFATSITGSYLTASEMLITDGSKNIVSAPVATYPSLTELTYLKGVTSAIQTQIDSKIDGTMVLNRIPYGSDSNTLQTSANLIYNSSNVSLGIGTSLTPVSRISFGNTNADSTQRIALYEATAGYYFYGIAMVNPSVGKYGVGIYGGTDLSLPTNTNMHLLVESTGNVGIGTSTPGAKLDVNGAVIVGGTLALGTNSLTMTGSLAATGARVTKGWFTDLESTNMPTVGGTAILTSLTAPQFTTIELGHASDTTLSRVSAGVVAIEGVTIDTISAANTLSNKTLTAPKFADLGFIADANGNELLIMDTVTSAVNEITLANAATTTNPSLTATGGDANVGLDINLKGTGTFNLKGNATQAAELRLYEDTDNGTNYSAFKVGAQAANITYTLPTAVGAAGTYLKDVAGDGVLSWATAGGGSPGWTFVSYTTGTGTTLDVSGLDLSADGAYKVIVHLNTDSSGTNGSFISLRISGSSSAEYDEIVSRNRFTGGSASSGQEGLSANQNWYITGTDAGSIPSAKINTAEILLTRGIIDGTNYRVMARWEASTAERNDGTNDIIHWTGAGFNSGQANVTSLNFLRNSTTGSPTQAWKVWVFKAATS